MKGDIMKVRKVYIIAAKSVFPWCNRCWRKM